MFTLSVKTVTEFLFHFLGNHCPLPSNRKREEERSRNKHYQTAIGDDPWVCGGGESEEWGDEGVYFLPFVLYTVKKERALWVLFILCFCGFFGSPQFFLL